MVVASLFFYLFAGTCVASGFLVIAARNPVHSVLFLILAFVSSAGLFVLMGAEFLAMILVVVYVGAVAVLFLFVVMMLDVDFAELRQGFLDYLPVGGVIGPAAIKQARNPNHKTVCAYFINLPRSRIVRTMIARWHTHVHSFSPRIERVSIL